MADTALPVIKAAIAAIKTAATTAGDRVYSDVPQKTTFPYVMVSVQSEPFAANDFSGQAHSLRVQAFSQKATISEALTIRAAVMAALDRQESALTLDTGTLVKCEYSGLSDAFIEDDGKTWQSVIEFEVVVV